MYAHTIELDGVTDYVILRFVIMPKFAINQSITMFTVLPSCDIKPIADLTGPDLRTV